MKATKTKLAYMQAVKKGLSILTALVLLPASMLASQADAMQPTYYPSNYPTQELADGQLYILCNLASPTGYRSLTGDYLVVTAHCDNESGTWYFVAGNRLTPNGETIPTEAEVKTQRKEVVIDRGGVTQETLYMAIGKGDYVRDNDTNCAYWNVVPGTMDGFYAIKDTESGAPMVVVDGMVSCATDITATDAEGMWAFVDKNDLPTFEAIGMVWERNIANAIDAVQANEEKTGIFTLSGIRLSTPMKGINIINGKKVWVR